jgi:hypothetical protein
MILAVENSSNQTRHRHPFARRRLEILSVLPGGAQYPMTTSWHRSIPSVSLDSTLIEGRGRFPIRSPLGCPWTLR